MQARELAGGGAPISSRRHVQMRRDRSLNCESVTQDTTVRARRVQLKERERELASAAALSRELSSREKIAPVRKLQAFSYATLPKRKRRGTAGA
jgi:hypothetical protein